MDHPTAGRRRRHKSPPTLHAPVALPVPRLDDHLDTDHGPSDEEGEKEATRQRSEPTTPTLRIFRAKNVKLPYQADFVRKPKKTLFRLFLQVISYGFSGGF